MSWAATERGLELLRRRRRTAAGLLAAAIVLALAVASASVASPGVPDGRYGTHGVSIQRGVGSQASALLPDGRGLIVTAFTSESADTHGKLIAGTLSVYALGPHGHRVRGFGTVLKSPGLVSADGAVRVPGGGFVVATSLLAKNSYPCRIELHGFDRHGHINPAFGSRGVLWLSTMGCGVRLLRAPNGTLLMAGESTTHDNVVIGMLLVRVSTTGHEVGATVAPIGGDFSQGAVSAAVVSPNGVATLVGTESDSQVFLARFQPDGQLDRSYGNQGIRLIGLRHVHINDATLDARGGLLLAGAHLQEFSGGASPVAGMLARTSIAGVVDRSFAQGGGARIRREIALDVVRLNAGGRVFAAGADGGILRFTARGVLDPEFGRSGISVLPPSGPGGDSPLYRISDLALVSGAAYVAASKYRIYEPAVERVLLR